ncbi:MAG: hypothetical protein DSY83_14600, partial [Flavobacteriia bacterium]
MVDKKSSEEEAEEILEKMASTSERKLEIELKHKEIERIDAEIDHSPVPEIAVDVVTQGCRRRRNHQDEEPHCHSDPKHHPERRIVRPIALGLDV